MCMELGVRLKEARLAAGLSQRQLCGEEITRNMLSQIENGSARPSMDTLRYLAERLGKSVSFFLEEDAVSSPNQASITAARAAFRAHQWEQVTQALADYREPDELFDEEAGLLRFSALLELAQTAVEAGEKSKALGLLEQAKAVQSLYRGAELERRRQLLTARAVDDPDLLPSLDEELLLRASLVRDPEQAEALLGAVQDRGAARWQILRGRQFLDRGDYFTAAQHLHLAEQEHPEETAPLLEICYRELEDYKMAYFYACKQR